MLTRGDRIMKRRLSRIAELGRAIRDELYPGATVEARGPYGLAREYMVEFHRRGRCRTLSLLYGGGRIKVRDYRRKRTDVELYPPGSIGVMNGLNYESEPVPRDATPQWFKPYISGSFRDNKKGPQCPS